MNWQQQQSDWYFERGDGTAVGPMPLSAIRKLLLSGQITFQTRVKKGLEGRWHSAKQIPDSPCYAGNRNQQPAEPQHEQKEHKPTQASTQPQLPPRVNLRATDPNKSEQVRESALDRLLTNYIYTCFAIACAVILFTFTLILLDPKQSQQQRRQQSYDQMIERKAEGYQRELEQERANREIENDAAVRAIQIDMEKHPERYP